MRLGPTAFGVPTALVLAACAGVPGRGPAGAGPAACTPDPAEESDARAAAARAEQCAEPHWLGRVVPCDTVLRLYSARSVAALSACTDRLFARVEAPDPDLVRRAAHDCTRALLLDAPRDACSADAVAREVCARARACGRETAVAGCMARGAAELPAAIVDTVSLWTRAGKVTLAQCLASLACGLDSRRRSAVDCLVYNSTGGAADE